MARWNTSVVTPLQFSRNCPGCRRRATTTPDDAPVTCTPAEVVALDPPDGAFASGPNSVSIVFNKAVVVSSFAVSVAGGPPNGNVPGSFVYFAGSFTAEFTASPPIAPGGGGFATVTVIVDVGTDCEQTIIWSFNIQSS